MRQLRRNDVVREEMNGVANDVDDDASISGKEADLETFVNLSILDTWREMYNYKVECVSVSTFWPKYRIHSLLLPPNHHVPIGRPRKKRTVNLDERAEKTMKVMIKDGKLSRKGNIVTCGKCGSKGHNKRVCIGPRNNQASGKGKKATRTEGVPDMEPSEVDT
ncbi:hypothetical protein Tco_0808613 [Tanacetum coccineum]